MKEIVMKDMLNTIHEGCGGEFVEINIWEDIACNRCGLGTDRYIYTPEEQVRQDELEAQREIERRQRSEAILADQIGTVYVLMKMVPYEGEDFQGVYVSEEAAREASGARPEDFCGPCQTYKIHAVQMNDAAQSYF